jgi:hypothetical protein
MEIGLDHESRSNSNGSPDSPSSETVSHVESELNDVVAALGLLGVKRCSQCRHFFRTSEPGALFDYGKLVCYDCVPRWWRELSAKISNRDREDIEGKLSSWLRRYHGAEVVKEDPANLPDARETEMQIVTQCRECRGSGKLLQGERCRFCNGLGTVWLVVPR